MINTTIVAIVGYLISSIPVLAILTKFTTGKELHEIGSGNTGVANTFQHAPKWVGIIGVFWQVAFTIGILVFSREVLEIDQLGLYIILGGLAFGNIYPVFHRFKGSKARTILSWGMLYLNPYVLAVLILIWGLVTIISKSSVLGVTVQLIVLPIAIYISERNWWIVIVVVTTGIILFINNTDKRDDISKYLKGGK